MKMMKYTNRGFALVMAIFLVVGLETVIAGSMLGMMRIQREAQRSADETRLSWAADAVIERAVKLLKDYVIATAEFPNTDIDGTVLGTHPDVTNNQNFDQFLAFWFSSLKTASSYEDALSRISIPAGSIKVTETDQIGDSKRTYTIEVTAHQKLSGDVQTGFQVTVAQEIELPKSQFFDFAVFYDKVLEITAGPDFALQGPIFSNEDIYLMNDAGSTLTLEPADDYSGGIIPQDYVMHSAGNIYFYFRRAIGENPYLSDPDYASAVPSHYQQGSGKEIFPNYNIGTAQNPKYPPFFYYFKNGGECKKNAQGIPEDPAGDNCKTNNIIVIDQGGSSHVLAGLGKKLPKMWPKYTYENGYALAHALYSAASGGSYNNQGDSVMSVSPVISTSDLAAEKPPVNHKWKTSSAYRSQLIQESPDVSEKTIPLGDPGRDPHLLIERNDPSDSPEVKRQKFHHKADVKIIFPKTCEPVTSANCAGDPDPSESQNAAQYFIAGPDPILRVESGSFSFWASRDIRNKWQGGGPSDNNWTDNYLIGYTLDIGKMIQKLDPDPKLVYISGFEGYSLMLTNGKKLPEGGLTVVTDGRLWIKGNYNTFSYDKPNASSGLCGENPADTNNPNCYCTEAEWDAHNCHVPPAAIFSDSFGVLSNDWDGFTSSYYIGLGFYWFDTASRRVQNNVMVNTALATGYLPSDLIQNSSSYTPEYVQTQPDSAGNLWASSGQFTCSSNDYAQGRDGVSDPCQYYKEGPFYYVNPGSTAYIRAMVWQKSHNGSSIPLCDPDGVLWGDFNRDGSVGSADYPVWRKGSPAADFDRDGKVDDFDYQIWRSNFGSSVQNGGSKPNCNTVRIPIFSDGTPEAPARTPVPPFKGILYKSLSLSALFTYGKTYQSYSSCPPASCPAGQTPQAVDKEVCLPSTGSEGGVQCVITTQNLCMPSGQPPQVDYSQCTKTTVPWLPRISHDNPTYFPIYKPSYSGGLENLINLQELWSWQDGGTYVSNTLRFLGTLSAPWQAKNPYLSEYLPNEYLYTAPVRKFDYNEDLRNHAPPEAPEVVSVKRLRWSRRFD